MIRAFMLLITLNVVCMSSYLTYNRMDFKFNSSEENIKQEMIKANHEMERKVKNEILAGREPEELIRFRESVVTKTSRNQIARKEKERHRTKLFINNYSAYPQLQVRYY